MRKIKIFSVITTLLIVCANSYGSWTHSLTSTYPSDSTMTSENGQESFSMGYHHAILTVENYVRESNPTAGAYAFARVSFYDVASGSTVPAGGGYTSSNSVGSKSVTYSSYQICNVAEYYITKMDSQYYISTAEVYMDW